MEKFHCFSPYSAENGPEELFKATDPFSDTERSKTTEHINRPENNQKSKKIEENKS